MIDLSVVLITKNQAWNIRRLLESVLRETAHISCCEIILVDSASTDRTVELACEYPIDILQLQPNQRLTAAAGRYVGQTHTSGEFVLFLDGDMEMCANWLTRALGVLRHSPRVAAVTGALLNIFPDGGSEIRDALESHEGLREVRSCGGAGLFRRSVLHQVGSFNPFLYSEEEPELCMRIRRAGYRVVQLGYTIANHYSPSDYKLSTVWGRWNRNLYVGFGQVVRYQLKNKLLWPYVRERGFVVAPGVALIAGLCCFAIQLLGGSEWWLFAWCLLFVLFLLITAVRKRSFRRTLTSLLNRSLGLVGTLRGLMLPPKLPQQFNAKVRFVRSAAEQITL